MTRGERWTDKETTVLRRYWPTEGISAIMQRLPDRTKNSIKSRAGKLGLTKSGGYKRQMPTSWTANDDAKLRALYAATTNKEIARMLGRSLGGIKNRSTKLGLTKPVAFKNRGRFVKGARAWNKGLSYHPGGNAAKHQFKKGNRHHNWVPIGHERVSKDGYLERKVADNTGPDRVNNFVAVHRLVWEEHNGPVPEGYVVAFINGNPKDASIDNLTLLSRVDNMRRNSAARFPPELHGQMIALGHFNAKLKKLIKKTREATHE